MPAPPATQKPSPSFAESSRLGRFIVLSATTGASESGALADDVKAQTRQALANLRGAAERAGTSIDRAAKVNVYLHRASDFAAMNEAYAPAFTSDPPARTTIVAGLRDPRALVEISMALIAPGEPRDVVHPAGWAKSANPYSYGIKSGDTMFLAGLVPRRGRDNSLVEGDVATQTGAVLDNARELLAAGGFTLADVVSSRVYITSAGAFTQFNEAYRTAFSTDPPARATVVTELMSPALDVEITFVAVRDQGRSVIGPAGNLPLSPAIVAGGRVFVSGMLGNTEQTRDNLAAQTAEMMARIGRTLAAAGHEWDNVGEGVLYVTDSKTGDVALAEMTKVFPHGLPAGVIVQTGLVAPDGLVELMVTAAK
jgi:enamine deaminase RidA (YjgF/YER057c/UK114 family)